MADFEGLINQALARQNAADPAVRERIYQSSRNALVKMLAKKGISTEDGVRPHFDRLEASIASIEAGFAPAPPPAAPIAPEPEPVAETVIEPPAPAPVAQPPADAPLEIATPQPPEPEPAPVEPEPQAPTPAPPSILSAAPPEDATAPDPAESSLDQQDAPDVPAEPQYAPAPETELVSGEPATADAAATTQSPESFMPDPVATPQLPDPEPAAAPPAEDPGSGEPQSKPIGSEPDIIAELEALMPKAYEPSPLFPAPENQPNAPVEPEPPAAAAIPSATPPSDPAAPAPQAEPEPRFDEPDANRPVEPYLGDVTGEPPTSSVSVDDLVANRDAPPVYKRKNPLLRRMWPILIAFAVVLVVLWILYALFANMPAGDQAASGEVEAGAVGEVRQAEDGSVYITLLEPTDLSALVTAGRGTAELLTQRNRQMLRLQSVRQGALTGSNADPILLELEKGVLRQVTGKEVTVEIHAQSGESGAAQFAIECDFGGDSICGRKRFRVGAQPERIVFALDLTGGISEDARSYLAISTDITSAADTTGNGDAVDVIYVRLRLPGEES